MQSSCATCCREVQYIYIYVCVCGYGLVASCEWMVRDVWSTLFPFPAFPLTAKAQADDHVADQGDAYETDQTDGQLLHPGQNICTPAKAKLIDKYIYIYRVIQRSSALSAQLRQIIHFHTEFLLHFNFDLQKNHT